MKDKPSVEAYYILEKDGRSISIKEEYKDATVSKVVQHLLEKYNGHILSLVATDVRLKN